MAEVLIVEDEGAVRQALRLVLEEADYSTQEVEDGLDGLQILWTCPDAKIVLLDHFLPHMNAEQLLVLVSDARERLRRHQYIEVTGGGDRLSPACRQLLSSLEIPVVNKPFDVDTLLAAVAQAEGRLSWASDTPSRVKPSRLNSSRAPSRAKSQQDAGGAKVPQRIAGISTTSNPPHATQRNHQEQQHTCTRNHV